MEIKLQKLRKEKKRKKEKRGKRNVYRQAERRTNGVRRKRKKRKEKRKKETEKRKKENRNRKLEQKEPEGPEESKLVWPPLDGATLERSVPRALERGKW